MFFCFCFDYNLQCCHNNFTLEPLELVFNVHKANYHDIKNFFEFTETKFGGQSSSAGSSSKRIQKLNAVPSSNLDPEPLRIAAALWIGTKTYRSHICRCENC